MSSLKDVPFIHQHIADHAGFEAAEGQDVTPPKLDKNSPVTDHQKTRAIDLFLRGAVTPSELARARTNVGGFEFVIGKSNFLPAVFLEIGAASSRATCLIRASGIDFRGRSGSWTGTGFLISPNILVTNNHVLNSTDVAAAGSAVFNYQIGKDRRPGTVQSFRLRPDQLFFTSPAIDGLDYTFCWVEGEPGRTFGTVQVDRQAFPIAEGEFSNIISHPDGRMKEISLQQNEVRWQDNLVVHYTSDTEPGSSGASVCNNNWQLFALHHASKDTADHDFPILNEGIKLSAIAADLDRIASGSSASAIAARELLKLFDGIDERLGFFGTLGRRPKDGEGLEAVVNSFAGTEQDIDVGFWNVEWLTKHYDTKTPAVANVMQALNLDVWCLEESSPNAAAAVATELRDTYGLEFDHTAAEPESEDGKQSCTILWNSKTVEVKPESWGEPIESWLKTRSTDFDDLGLGGFEAVHGKIFDRYPALFHVTAKTSGPNGQPFDFYLVPLHLKAMAEGSLRRKMASKILAVAVQKKIEEGVDADFIVGGDANAELETGDFSNITGGGMTAVSAADEQGGAFSYIKGPKSLIDHIFLSPNLARRFSSSDFFIVAAERTFPNYVAEISDHRPVLLRMSLWGAVPREEGMEAATNGTRSATIMELKERLRKVGWEPERNGFERAQRDWSAREGYNVAFLGEGELVVSLPELPQSMTSDALVVSPNAAGLKRYELPYTHYSVVMNRSRRMAFYSAVNIDGSQLVSVPETRNWHADSRIPESAQTLNDVYKNNDLDKGHLTRRLDPVWGPRDIAAKAEDDTHAYPNACPQHHQLNSGEWLQLEDYVLRNSKTYRMKICVFTGPVLRPNDREYRGIQLPQEFWKVVIMQNANTGRLSATAYLQLQRDLISGFEFLFGPFKTYQVRISRIAQLTGLDFGRLVNFDPLAHGRARPDGGFEAGVSEVVLVTGAESLVL